MHAFLFEDEDEVIEHGLLVLARGAAKVAEESAAGDHHLVGGVLLETVLPLSPLARLVLRRPRDAVHHDGDDVLVDAQDADEVGVLEEHVVVHKCPGNVCVT